MSHRFFPGIAAAAAALTVTVAAESLRIVPVVHGNQVLVSFELADAYTDALRSTISSGLRTTFTYEMDLRMVVPVWVDRTIATAVVTTSVEYDNLTRRHTLTRAVDGEIVDSLVAEDEDVVREWLTSLRRIPLCRTSLLDRNRDYYVRVRARARPSSESFLGLVTAITGQVRFTYIP